MTIYSTAYKFGDVRQRVVFKPAGLYRCDDGAHELHRDSFVVMFERLATKGHPTKGDTLTWEFVRYDWSTVAPVLTRRERLVEWLRQPLEPSPLPRAIMWRNKPLDETSAEQINDDMNR